ncbi:MAG: heparinase II/III family protein [Anaerolineae bacterium]
MTYKTIKQLFILLISASLLLAACQTEESGNDSAPSTEIEPTTVAVEASDITEDEPTTSPTETAGLAEEATAMPEPTLVPEPVPTLRSIETSGPISDPGGLLDEYMSEGLFISHFDSADTELWYSYSQDSETTIINSDVAPPEGYISSSTWHAKQTDKWVLPTDDLNFQSDKVIAGDGAAIWSDTVLSTRLTVIDIPHDWSEYAFLSFWAHSSNANDAGIQLAIYSELDSTSADDYYKKEVIIDWEGWRLFEIPLHEFRATRDPVGWNKVDYLKIASSGWGHTPVESTELIFDEMKLSNVRLGPKLSIDIPTDLEHPHLFLDTAEIDEIKQKIETYDWAQTAFESLQAEADSLIGVDIIVPDTGGGFYHDDDDAAYAITQRHYDLADIARDSGLMYQFTDNPLYMEKAREILLAYSDAYLTYDITDKEGRTGDQASAGGRATAQGINEARWIIPLAWAFDLVYNDLTEAERTKIADQLLRPAADLIMLNNEGRHNHQTWYNSGVGVIGFVLGDAEYIWYSLLKDDSSLNYQLDKSVTTDGMWYEGTMHYQFYVLRALQPLMEATHHAGFNVYDNPQYKGLFDFMVTYADPGLEMPTINDGRVVNLTDSDRVTYYELAYRRLGDPTYVPILEESRRTDLNALLYGVGDLGAAAEPAWQTELYSDSDLTVMRSGTADDGIQATVNFMGYQGGHSHADQLSLVLYGAGAELAPDAGSIKYRIPEQEAYFKTTLAHNALVVDGISQERAAGGELTKFVANGSAQMAQVRSSDLYDGVTLQRTVLLNDDYLIDLYNATSEDVHTYDWVYHNRGNFSTTSDAFAPVADVSGTNGYEYLTGTESADIDADLQADWRVSSDAYVRATLLGEPGTTYITARGPIAARKNDEIAGQPIPMVISRRQEITATQFASIIQPYSDSAELLTPIDIAIDSDTGRALEIERDSATDLLILDDQFNTKQVDGLQFTGTWSWLSQIDGNLHWAITNGTELIGDGWRLAQEDLSGLDQPEGMGMYFEVPSAIPGQEVNHVIVANTYEFVSFITLEGFLDSATEINELDADGNFARTMPIKTNENGVIKFLAQPGMTYEVVGE